MVLGMFYADCMSRSKDQPLAAVVLCPTVQVQGGLLLVDSRP